MNISHEGIESAIFALSFFATAGAVLVGVLYCLIIIKDLVSKIRSKHD